MVRKREKLYPHELRSCLISKENYAFLKRIGTFAPRARNETIRLVLDFVAAHEDLFLAYRATRREPAARGEGNRT